ncbi:35465_t:CDS:1, partial [Gigaspora margarita]
HTESNNPYMRYIVVRQLKRDSDEELGWSISPMVSSTLEGQIYLTLPRDR